MKRRSVLCVLLCFLAFVLCGCGEDLLAATAPERYTVRFLMNGEVLSAQSVEENACPEAPAFVWSGYVFEGWLDPEGRAVDPETMPVSADRDYTALAYPDFGSHAPYLMVDEDGNVRPKDVLVGGELREAFERLAADATILSGVTFPSDGEYVTADVLETVLTGLFPNAALEAALGCLPEGSAVTRGGFAEFVNDLTGRGGEETLRLGDGISLPKDLPLNREDSADILEAVLPHTPDPDGVPVLEAVLEMPWEPGFTNLCGWLYYADEEGHLLRDAALGTVTFGPDGYYTSGDPELDTMVADFLNTVILENPEKDRMDWLYCCYRYCRDHITYVPRDILDFGATGWEVEFGKAALNDLVGNCYGYAASFCVLARGLGYDAWCVSGLALENRGPHGWVEMNIDGIPYVFDPQVERQYMYKRESLNLFKMTYGWANGWLYIRPEKNTNN